MSGWKNVLWEDPEEGQVYDVWVVAKDCQFRATDFKFIHEKWESESGHELDVVYGNVDMQITHFMPSPDAPKD